ncbi:MAG: hypothetical protein AAFR17_16215 [Pseudomonadota bacterium]
MSEEIFHFPGRYRLAREAGRLTLTLWLGAAEHCFALRPRQGYALLMGRRRTELLYAIAVAQHEVGAGPDTTLIDLCTEGSEVEISALATRWDDNGMVTLALAEVLGQPIFSPHWFAPRRRTAWARVKEGTLC